MNPILNPAFLNAACSRAPKYDPRFRFIAEEDGSSVTFNICEELEKTPEVEFSLDGQTYAPYTGGQTINLNKGEVVFFRGEAERYAMSDEEGGSSQFVMFGRISAKGQISYLLKKDGTEKALKPFSFYHLFEGCTSLTSAPELPATTLADYCYAGMFEYCSLTSAPELPATILADYCYADMFEYCIGLTSAPELPATTLVDYCYSYMFRGCPGLTSVSVSATEWNTSHSLSWLLGVAATGTFTKPAGTTIPSGTSGIPVGWTVINK